MIISCPTDTGQTHFLLFYLIQKGKTDWNLLSPFRIRERQNKCLFFTCQQVLFTNWTGNTRDADPLCVSLELGLHMWLRPSGDISCSTHTTGARCPRVQSSASVCVCVYVCGCSCHSPSIVDICVFLTSVLCSLKVKIIPSGVTCYVWIVAIVLTSWEFISRCTFKFGAVLRLVRLTPPHQRAQINVTFGCAISHYGVRLSSLQVTQEHRSVPSLDHFVSFLLLLWPAGLPGIHGEASSLLVPCQGAKEGGRRRDRESGRYNRCTVLCALAA